MPRPTASTNGRPSRRRLYRLIFPTSRRTRVPSCSRTPTLPRPPTRLRARYAGRTGNTDTPLSASIRQAARRVSRSTLPIRRVVGPAEVAALAIHKHQQHSTDSPSENKLNRRNHWKPASCRGARGCQRPDAYPEHRLSVARDSNGPAAALDAVRLFRSAELGRHARSHPRRALCAMPGGRLARGESDRRDHRQPERQGRGKRSYAGGRRPDLVG